MYIKPKFLYTNWWTTGENAVKLVKINKKINESAISKYTKQLQRQLDWSSDRAQHPAESTLLTMCCCVAACNTAGLQEDFFGGLCWNGGMEGSWESMEPSEVRVGWWVVGSWLGGEGAIQNHCCSWSGLATQEKCSCWKLFIDNHCYVVFSLTVDVKTPKC